MTYINKHLDHIEDAFLGSPDDVQGAFDFLSKYPTDDNERYATSLKWDGGVSIIFGTNPDTKQFIVGTKGVLNKTPIFATSKQQVSTMFPLAVASMLIGMYDDLATIPPKEGLYQADVIWTPEILSEGGYASFKPNALRYKFTEGIAPNFFLKFKYALALHTRYNGKTLKTIEGSPILASEFSDWFHAEKTFFMLPNIMKGTVVPAFRPLYFLAVIQLEEIIQQFEPLPDKQAALIKQYLNYQVKRYGDLYIPYIPELSELVTFLNQLKQTKHTRALLETIATNEAPIVQRLEAVSMATVIKMTLIEMLNGGARKHRIQVVDGDHEGFVVFDKQTEASYKLVNRHIFSYQNFKQHGEVING